VVIDPSSTIPMVGASGAISGVMGGYLRLFPRARVVTLIPVFILMFVRDLPATMFIALWFLIQLVGGVESLASLGDHTGGVAFFAHIGGFLAGLALTSVLGPSRNRTGGFSNPYVRRSVH
jgi:membrane associated rhomboid family serine protease